eukprot:3179924-Rhodomonas_salina.1
MPQQSIMFRAHCLRQGSVGANEQGIEGASARRETKQETERRREEGRKRVKKREKEREQV